MTTTGDEAVVLERIPALTTTHYEFVLRSPVVCIRRDGCWVVSFQANMIGKEPLIYAFGDPEEPIAPVLRAFTEAVCATWCGALRAVQNLPALDMEPSIDDELPPYPDAEPIEIDDATDEPIGQEDCFTIWTGDEMRSAIRLMDVIHHARRSEYCSQAHHKGMLAGRHFKRQHVERIAEQLKSRYKNSIFW